MFPAPRTITRRIPAIVLGAILIIAGAAPNAAAAAYSSMSGRSISRAPQLVVPQEEDDTPVPASVAVPVQRAQLALSNAVIHVGTGDFTKAATNLRHMRKHLRSAHRHGMALIGAPPTDPESDEPPGPPAVIAVLGLEHTIVVRGTPLFDDLRTSIGLNKALLAAMRRRNTMLDTVIALPQEGARS